VPVFTASIDDRIDEKGFVVPGIGDAGDRMFGTK
jgi:uracil phosphoribosyltransferase